MFSKCNGQTNDAFTCDNSLGCTKVCECSGNFDERWTGKLFLLDRGRKFALYLKLKKQSGCLTQSGQYIPLVRLCNQQQSSKLDKSVLKNWLKAIAKNSGWFLTKTPGGWCNFAYQQNSASKKSKNFNSLKKKFPHKSNFCKISVKECIFQNKNLTDFLKKNVKKLF